MVQCEPAHTFKTMAELHIFKATPTSKNSETTLIVNNLPDNMKVHIRSSSEKDDDTLDDSKLTRKSVAGPSDPCQAPEEITEQQPRVEDQPVTSVEEAEVRFSTCKRGLNAELNVSNSENKENAAIPAAIVAEGRSQPVFEIHKIP